MKALLIFILIGFNFERINIKTLPVGIFTHVNSIDFNTDGRTDLILWGENTAPLILENVGWSNFLEREDLVPSEYSYGVMQLSVINYNGDEFPDIFILSSLPGAKPEILQNQEGERFLKITIDVSLPEIVESIELTDANADGKDDIIFKGSQDGIFYQKENYTFESKPEKYQNPSKLNTLLDFNLDGVIDTLFLEDSVLYLNDSTLVEDVQDYTVLDWDEDNLPDIIFLTRDTLFCLRNTLPPAAHSVIKTGGVDELSFIVYSGASVDTITSYKTARIDLGMNIDSLYVLSDTVLLPIPGNVINAINLPITILDETPDTLVQVEPRVSQSRFRLRYIVKSEGFIRISLFSRDGRFIQTLEEGYRYPGIYYIDFEDENLKPGVYIIKFEEPEGIHSTKVIITG